MSLVRNKLFWVAVVCIAPFILGTAAYLLRWTPGTTSNYGELVEPRPLPSPALAPLRGKWVLVAFDAAACDAYCEKKLYYLRQVRRAQGEAAHRVERLWVLTDGGSPRPELLAAIEGTRIARFSTEHFPGEPAAHIYLVDPLGNLMMRFPRDPDPSRMIKDLQRLLKYSRIG